MGLGNPWHCGTKGLYARGEPGHSPPGAREHGKNGKRPFFKRRRALEFCSGKLVSNSRPQPWQGCALPTELFPHLHETAWCCACFVLRDVTITQIFYCATHIALPHPTCDSECLACVTSLPNHPLTETGAMNLSDLKQFGLDIPFPYKQKYDNYIGGKWVPPVNGEYFENLSPITGKPFCQVPRSGAQDIELALDAAHAVRQQWARTPAAERSNILLRIADRMEENLHLLAVAETIDNRKPLRETTAADPRLAVDHFRYFAGCLRAQEGAISDLDPDTVAYHFQEPIGVVGQIIPWNFPLLMAAWKLAPALAAGCPVVMKPAEQTPASILLLMELIG